VNTKPRHIRAIHFTPTTCSCSWWGREYHIIHKLSVPIIPITGMKAKVSVTVDPDLGRKAKSQGVNLSKTLNEALEEKVE